MKSEANTFFNFTKLAKRNAKLGGAFDSFDVVTTKDMLADFLRNTRIKTSSFERFSDRNYLQGKDGKTIRLKWLSAKGTSIDVLANDFINQYSYMNLDESEVIQDIVDIVVSYPTGVGAYASARYSELMDEMQEFERMAKSRGVQPDNEDFDFKKFEQAPPESLFVKDTDMRAKKKPVTRKKKMKPVAKKAVKKTASKKRKSKAVRVAYSKEFQLIKRLYLLNGKSVKVAQLERLLVEVTALLKRGAASHIQTLNLIKSKLQLSVYKLNGFQTESIDKLLLSKDLFSQLENIATKPKIRVTLDGAIDNNDEWKQLPDGGQYLDYKGYFIGRACIGGKYKFSYILNNSIANKASSFSAAKKAIDSHIGNTGKISKKKAQKAPHNLTSLYGIETYTLAEAKALGIIDEKGNNLAGVEPKAKNPYDVINRILIKQINKGSIPWEIPWSISNGKSIKPQNLRSKREYRGVNFWALLGEMDERAHDIPYFLTSKQIAEKGGSLIKGAKPYYVTYYGKFVTTEIEIDRETGEHETEEKLIKFLKLYAVYNVADMEGIKYEVPDKKPIKQVERIASAEAIIENMPKRPVIKFGGNQASYSPSTDIVKMPNIENFKQVDRYYSTFFHELVHSTKDDKRCGTDSFRKNSKAYGDKQYSWEELVAELGACYLCGEAGILHKTVGHSATYAKGWANKLVSYIKDDKTYFFKAANYAQKAADFILNRAKNNLSGLEPGSNASDGVTEDIINAAKEVWPKASVMVIPPNKTLANSTKKGDTSGVQTLDQVKSGGTFRLKGDIGKLLGDLGNEHCSITLEGDQGGGKSQLAWIICNAMADMGFRVKIYCPELLKTSPFVEYLKNKYISKENQSKIPIDDSDETTMQKISDEANTYDFALIDSCTKLKDYNQFQFTKLFKSNPTKKYLGLFQRATSGEIRGGNTPIYDAYLNIEVAKVDDTFVNNYAYCSKNRFGATGGKYNISKMKIIDENKGNALNGVAKKSKKGEKK